MRIIALLIFFVMATSLKAETLQEKLVKLGSHCDQEKITICLLPENILGYPNKMIFLFHNSASPANLWIHLHGHSLGKLSSGEDFDSTPQNMIHHFQFSEVINNNINTLLVIPFTEGRCKDYDNYLVYPKNFENLIQSLHSLLASPLPVHLSAHSGGGRTLAKTINRIKTNIKSVSLFDANYNFDYVSNYTRWVELPGKKLSLIAVAPEKVDENYSNFSGATPFNISKVIFDKILINKKRILTDQEQTYVFQKNAESATVFLYQAKSSPLHHWYIVKNSFSQIMQSTLQNFSQE